MGPFIKFITAHVWPTVSLVVGSVIAIGSALIGAFKIVTLPIPWPALLALGLFIFFAGVILLLFAYHKADAAPVTQDAHNDTNVAKAESEVEPFGGGLLGNPVGAGPMMVAGNKIPPRPPHLVLPTEIPQQSEKDELARDELGLLAEEIYAPATRALGDLKCFLRDQLKIKLERNGKTPTLINAVVFGIDRNHRRCECSGIPQLSPIHWLYQSETLQFLSKKAALDIFCGNFEDYKKDVEICIDLVHACTPFYNGNHVKLLELYGIWRDQNTLLVSGLERLSRNMYLKGRVAYLVKERLPREFPDLVPLKSKKDHFE